MATQSRREIVAPAGQQMNLPFSPAVFSGDFLYVSGNLGNRPGTTEVPGDVAAQTRQALENIRSVLEAAGLGFEHVVSSNVYLVDSRDFAAMNEVYRSYFPSQPPARATVEGGLVVRNARVEISVIAHRAGEKKIVRPAAWPAPGSPYSYGVRVGDLFFAAGMVSENPAAGELVEGDATIQTRQSMNNLKTVLESEGMSMADVVGCRVYLADSRDFQAMNIVWREFFPTSPPVRATMEARLALPELIVEIQCTASADSGRQVVGDASSGRPFSPAIQAGDKLYVAGMVGRGANGFAAGDIREQTRQTLRNVQAALQAGGLDLEDVVDATVFITDVRHFADMNEIYAEMVPGAPPARATVGMNLMSPDALVEIMVTAARK